MVFGKHKKELERLKKENVLLAAKLKTIQEKAPDIEQALKLLSDLRSFGGGMLEIRRLDPNSIFQWNL